MQGPRNDLHRPTIGERNRRDFLGVITLIARILHLALGRQVHPQLESMQTTPESQEVFRRQLAVNHSRARRHPLHATRSDDRASPGGVFVHHRPVEEIGDGLESAVRMTRRADRLARCIVSGSHLIQQQERIDVIDDVRRERSSHDESTSFDGAQRIDDAEEWTLGHCLSFRSRRQSAEASACSLPWRDNWNA